MKNFGFILTSLTVAFLTQQLYAIDRCQPIKAACTKAGYQNDADCMNPFLSGKSIRGMDSSNISAADIETCRPTKQVPRATQLIRIEKPKSDKVETTGPITTGGSGGPASEPINTGPATSPEHLMPNK